jgi:hypothetical protein
MKPRPTIVLALLLACGGGAPPPAASTAAPAAGDAPPVNSTPDGLEASATHDTADASAGAAGLAAGSGGLDAGSAAAPPAPAPDAGPSFDFALVEQIVKQHKDAVRVACWDKSKSTEKAYVGTMSIRVGPTGNVVTVDVDGTDKPASKCIEKQVKTWKFPPPSGTASIKVPIRLRRD